MKIIHLSDLHIGKRLKEISLYEDQNYILAGILKAVDDEKPDAVIIAGDVYDKSVPSAEAVALFDSFLSDLAKRGLKVFIISGNHDSPERTAFGYEIFEAAGVYISPVYNGEIKPVTLSDEYGEVNFWLLPFIKPAHVRAAIPGAEINSYTDAVRTALEKAQPDTAKRNVLVTHQFVTGARTSDSEEVTVGGTDNVDAAVFDGFDYVALGHLHSPQSCGRDTVRYCGTPLKYSFSEENDEKSITVVTLGAKGDVNIGIIPLKPLRDMKTLKGKYADIMQLDFYGNTTYREDYVRIILTDEDEIPDAVKKLRTVYRNITELSYDNRVSRRLFEESGAGSVKSKSPLELFAEFFEAQRGIPLSEFQQETVRSIIEESEEESV